MWNGGHIICDLSRLVYFSERILSIDSQAIYTHAAQLIKFSLVFFGFPQFEINNLYNSRNSTEKHKN